MSIRAFGLGLTFVITIAASAAAQTKPAPSLGEVARAAEAAKPTVKKAKKTYTNAALKPDPHGDAPAPAASSSPVAPTTASAKPAAAEEATAGSEQEVPQEEVKESEDAWRRRAARIRTQIEQLQARLVIMNKPSEARNNNPAAQARHATELNKVTEGLQSLKTDWAALEERAVAAKVPSAWLDPRPAQ
jgi:hypothetical protein